LHYYYQMPNLLKYFSAADALKAICHTAVCSRYITRYVVRVQSLRCYGMSCWSSLLCDDWTRATEGYVVDWSSSVVLYAAARCWYSKTSGKHVTESCSIDSTGCPQWRLVYMGDQTTYQQRRHYRAYIYQTFGGLNLPKLLLSAAYSRKRTADWDWDVELGYGQRPRPRPRPPRLRPRPRPDLRDRDRDTRPWLTLGDRRRQGSLKVSVSDRFRDWHGNVSHTLTLTSLATIESTSSWVNYSIAAIAKSSVAIASLYF